MLKFRFESLETFQVYLVCLLEEAPIRTVRQNSWGSNEDPAVLPLTVLPLFARPTHSLSRERVSRHLHNASAVEKLLKIVNCVSFRCHLICQPFIVRFKSDSSLSFCNNFRNNSRTASTLCRPNFGNI